MPNRTQAPEPLADPLAEANQPSSLLVQFGPDKALQLDSGAVLVAVPDRLPDLRRTQRRTVERRPRSATR
jgi:hypothetical protein